MKSDSHYIKDAIINIVKSHKDHKYNNLTLKELADIFEKEIQEKELLEKKEEENLLNKYKNVYLKFLDKDKTFGPTLYIYKVNKIAYEAISTDWEKLYRICGERIMISGDMGVKYTTVNKNDTWNNSVSKKSLQKYKFITEEEYNNYYNEFLTIDKQINKLLQDENN